MTAPENNLPDEDELSAEEIRQLWRRRFLRKVLFITAPAVLLLGIILLLAIPRIKDWRARGFAEQAELLLAEGKIQEAYNNASSAMQLRPALPAAQRSYAAVLVAAGQPGAVEVLQKLAESGEATVDDRAALVDAALRFNDVATAEEEALSMLQSGEATPRAQLLLARVRLAQGRPEEAAQSLQESIESGGGAAPAILLSRLLLGQNTEDSVAAAADLLRPIARQPDQEGLEALLVLLGSPALRLDESRTWIEAVRQHPLANDEQKLAAADAEIRLDPRSYREVVAKTVETYRNGTVEQRILLGRWLNQNREYQAALEITTPDESLQRRDLFLIRLDAMAGQGDWEGISRLLAGNNLPLQAPLVLLYRGRAARETGDAQGAITFYRRAVIEAAPTQDLMWYVINYLQRLGEDQVLEQELERLTENPATARQAFQALVPLVQKRRDAEDLFQLYQRMIARLPADRIVQNDLRYFATLTGRRPDPAGARTLVESEPQMLAYRITLALVLLQSGDAGGALRVFDGITLDPAQIQPYQRAVLAAVLGANGRAEEARQLARDVPEESVTTREIELIAPWRGGD